MFGRTVLFLLFAGIAALNAQTAQDKQKTITYDGKIFHLTETGNNPSGEYARFLLPGEEPDHYTIKLGTLLCDNPVNNDPIETAKATLASLQDNPAAIFIEQILVNKNAPAAIIIFGYKFPEGDFQMNVWKYEKRIYGIFCDQIMIASLKGQDAASFKIWALQQKEDLVKSIAGAHWPASSNQTFME